MTKFRGVTAYAGMIEVAEVGEGDVAVVTAAAGSVGSAAGQIAKLRGARVIGIAGGADKARKLAFLMSDAAGQITGANLVADSGMTL